MGCRYVFLGPHVIGHRGRGIGGSSPMPPMVLKLARLIIVSPRQRALLCPCSQRSQRDFRHERKVNHPSVAGLS
jgi:hypothetical protein